MTHFASKIALSVAVGSLLLAAGCNKETDINDRHVHGIVTIPPLVLAESEPALRDDAHNNDTLPNAEGPFQIAYGYHILRGQAETLCGTIDATDLSVRDCDGGIAPGAVAADADYYRIRSAYRGGMVFKARVTDEAADAHVDISFIDGTSGEVQELLPSSTEPQVDEEGNQVLDEEGNVVSVVPEPRSVKPVNKGDEFIVRVRVSAGSDDVDTEVAVPYELIIAGEDVRLHSEAASIEGDAVVHEPAPVAELEPLDPLDLKVGAYLSGDIDRLGNPVAGTSCKDWTLDDESETFWCPWEMVFAQRVSVESNELIEGMGDDKDNDCDGIADEGDSTEDKDGDGWSPAQGDCDDTDAEIGPFRGDLDGDFKDNDCDGWADNGPDDRDDDGDGYCENGVDLDAEGEAGHGVCRGPDEVLGDFGTGDCNDTDPTIFPGVAAEVPHNGIDDDCSAGDSALPPAVNTDGDGTYISGAVHEWTDIEETLCGSDPLDEGDKPSDDDGDGLCDSDCLGTVGCGQDIDGDGLHSWEEYLCGSDPEVADSELPDFDGDGVCDGKDSDADGDGFDVQAAGGDGTDCNDRDTAIHPHITDETGEVTSYRYDVLDGVDSDCDGLIDENRDWLIEGGEYVQNDVYTIDRDGDGHALGTRDCNDTDASVYLGAWELRSTNIVVQDFSQVYLFAGDVSSLNTTGEQAGRRRMTETLPFNLETERAAWELTEDWPEGDPPHLVPSGLPVLNAWYAKQPEVGAIWYEDRDANGDEVHDAGSMAGFAYPEAPAPEGMFQELGDAAGAGKTNELYGRIDSIVQGSWDGDVDTYHMTFPEGGFLSIVFDWDTAGGDYDAAIACYYFDSVNPADYYYMPTDPGLTDASKPEEGSTTVALPDGSDCWLSVVGYSGSAGAYSVFLTPQGN